ncbi:MAG: magnesium transporter [Clostridiales bacterium]|nr:magnesium transporter [Clostridiales bacterium]
MKIIIEKFQKLIANQEMTKLREELLRMNEVDAADLIEQLDTEQTILVFRLLPKGLAAEVFSNLESEAQQLIISAITDTELSRIMDGLFMDDAVDMLEEMPANVVKRVLANTSPESRNMMNQLLKYPENSVGSIMTVELFDLKGDLTVGQAIQRIRTKGDGSELIYNCYVTDKQRKLEGVITLRELLTANDDQIVSEIMTPDVITAHTTEDQEEAARRIMRYDFLALPVVDGEGRLVGIVTVDDVMDVMEAEATEDFERMAAMTPSEKPYLKTSPLSLANKRIGWLLFLMVSGMITGGILGKYEAAFAAMPLLVTFIPMLTDTGGNAGSQSSTLIIRGMVVGEITMGDWFKVFWKELRVSLLVGSVLSAANFIRLIITYPGQYMMALTVALAMYATVILAKTVGGILPMVAKLFKADPAIMASPLITTIVDAISLIIYFTLAELLLGL